MDLKQQLAGLDDQDLRSLTKERRTTLINEMLKSLGSTDSYLRDGLIYPTMARIIAGNMLDADELNCIMDTCLDQRHLFFKLGEVGDSVFMRAFSSLVVAELLRVDAQKSFLAPQALVGVEEAILRYMAAEEDIRGYVKGKGWAHAIAHGADMLTALVKNPAFSTYKFPSALATIENCLFKEAAYADDEDVRLLFAVKAMLERGLSYDDLEEWVFAMCNRLAQMRETDGASHAYYRCRKNLVGFMKNLYFMMKMDGGKTGLRVALVRKAEELHKQQYRL